MSKIKNDITLDDKDMIRLIFAPLTHKDDKEAIGNMLIRF